MTDQIDQIDEPDTDSTAASASRRSFVTKGAIAAAVGAAAGVAMNQSASAANGDDLNLGLFNTATDTTGITGGSTFYVRSGNSLGDASIYGFGDTGTRATKYGVRGEFTADTTSSPGSAGVYGVTSTPAAAGVYGEHPSDTQTGPGVVGVSARGNGVEGSSDDGYGIYGETTSSNLSSTAIYGDAKGSGGTGVYGQAAGTRARGIYGVVTGTNAVGVAGKSDNGDGVVGEGSRYDLYAAGSGIANLKALSSTITPTTAGTAGSIAHSDDGSLWFCYATNAWRQLDLAAGIYTAITPGRVYDSRFEAEGRFSGGENRTISVADSRSVTDYSVDVADLVPAGATSVTGNVVAIAPDANGFLAINPGGVTAITASTLNFTAGQNIANGSTFALNANREVECVFGPGASAHVALDITGFTI